MGTNLTQRTVEAVKPPKAGQAFIRDAERSGLALRITANGAKSFVWEGRAHGRPRRMTIGPYPALTVVAARREALKIQAAVAQGRDPSEERQAQRREPTFKDLAELFIERHAKQHKRSWKRDEQTLTLHLSKWNNRRVSDISRDEVIRLHQSIGESAGYYAANRALALLRTMLNLATDWGILQGQNPARRVKMFREEKRDRFLSPEELKKVNASLLQEPNPYWRAFFPLGLLLGARRSELLGAKWADVDFGQRTWRIPATKAGRPHLLPLPEPAVAILDSLPSKEQSEWVFPGEGASGHLVEPKKAWQRIRARAEVPDVRIHDLRRTLGSWLAAGGYSLPLIGKALNHTSVATTAVYARLNIDPVREALEKNAALMLAVPIKSQSKRPRLGRVKRGMTRFLPADKRAW